MKNRLFDYFCMKSNYLSLANSSEFCAQTVGINF